MSDLSNNDYFSFDNFVKQYFQERNIITDDLNGTSNKDFKKKYNITKNDLHKVCVAEYKKHYPSDYEKHVEIYKAKQQAMADKYNKKRMEIFEKRKGELIEVLMRQTDYSKEKAIEELEAVQYNVSAALSKYMGVDKTSQVDEETSKEPKSTNQKIFKEIRDFMDKGSRDYERRKEYSKLVMEQQNRQREEERKEN